MATRLAVRPRRSERVRQEEMVRLLGSVPIFGRCSKRELRSIAAIAQVVDVPAGRAVVREGEPGRDFAVIVEGAAEVRRKQRLLRRLGTGDWLGEIALLTGGPRTATVTTTAPSRLLVIRGGAFRGLVEHTPSLAYKLLGRVAALVPTEGRC